MTYSVEFEIQSNADEAVNDFVYKSLVSAFGNIDKLRVIRVRTYVATLERNTPFVWKEVSQNRTES